MAPADRTHYEVLGIARDADADEVRRAWRMLVQVWHPDRFEGDMQVHAETQAALINAAYHCLRDAGRRAAYDCRIASDDAAKAPAPTRSSARRIPTFEHVAANAPIGGVRVAQPARPTGVDGVWADIVEAVRRHPRLITAAAVAWVVVFGGGLVFHSLSGPSLPTVDSSSRGSSIITASGGGSSDDLAKLAAEARRDAAAQEQAYQQMLRDDAAAQAEEDQSAQAPAEATDPRAGADQAPAAAPAPAEAQPKVQEIRKADGTHVLRVMPG